MAYKPKNSKPVLQEQPAKEKASKKISMKEFQAWLSGVEEMQPQDWHPDLNQWRIIRTKIDTVVTTISRPVDDDDDTEEYAPRGTRRGPVQYEPSALASSMISPTAPAFAVDDAGRLKTPNVDTSAQPYASSLE